jgi:hypothetical protein
MLFLLGVTGGARGATVAGFNPELSGAGGELFIPLTPGASGTLGDPLGGGEHVGLDSDAMTLSVLNPDSAGRVRLLLEFDLSSVLSDPLDVIDSAGPTDLVFSFDDLDFKAQTVINGGRVVEFKETMSLWFLEDAGMTPGPTPDLVIGGGNYLTYRSSPSGSATNGVETVYTVALADLGVFDTSGISGDREFGLVVELGSETTSTGLGLTTLPNTAESVAVDFVFNTATVPEPATMAFVGLGGLIALLARRRRR